MILGLDCLKRGTQCLGDCPDAAYFGPHIRADSDEIKMLTLSSSEELHVVTMVNHRMLNASVYGSIALLRSASPGATMLSKTRMSVRATPVGITSFDWPNADKFVSWAFTRNPAHCPRLMESSAVDGCSVLDASQVSEAGHFTYCERVYLNPNTGTGPHWGHLLPAQLHHIRVSQASHSYP